MQSDLIRFFLPLPCAKRARMQLPPGPVPSRDAVLSNKNLLLHALSFVGAVELIRFGALYTNKIFLKVLLTENKLWRRQAVIMNW